MSGEPQALPRPLRVLLGAALERAMNRALALDPGTQEQLAALEGRRVLLRIPAPPLALAVAVVGGRLRVGPPLPMDEADLSISASLGAALAQAVPWREAVPPLGKVRIAGDAELARRVQALVQHFDPDWDAALSRTVGDVAGHQLGKALRRARRFAREGAAALARDGADFLVQESRDLVASPEIAHFCDEVDLLRDRLERLQARIARLR